jgi:F0F1-type ATP synthase assembly protein I
MMTRFQSFVSFLIGGAVVGALLGILFDYLRMKLYIDMFCS